MNNLTEQEKKFADAFVYLFFHAPALMPGMKEDAAVYAGYDVPVDRNAADNFARALSEKANIKQYIDSEIERFRGILSDDQSMRWRARARRLTPSSMVASSTQEKLRRRVFWISGRT